MTEQAVVLRCWDWSETSQTAALFCREIGLLRGLAKGSRRPKSSFSGGLEPLTRGEAVAIVKPSTELAILTEWDLQELFPGPRRSLGAHYAALYMADLVRNAIGDEDPHPALWDAMVAALRDLGTETDQGKDAAAMPGLLRFQWAILDETGRRPLLSKEAGDGDAPRVVGFDPETGAIAPDPGPGEGRLWRARRTTIKAIDAVCGQTPSGDNQGGAGVAAVLVEQESVCRANRLLAAYAAAHLEGVPPSLRAIFPDFG